MRRPGLAVVLALALVASGVPPVGLAAGGAQSNSVAQPDGGAVAQTVPEVVVAQSFAALPDRPGRVRATRSFEIPEAVESLRTRLPADAAVTGTSGGFEPTGGGGYEWTGGSRSPSITYVLPVNETGVARGPESADGRFTFVDVGEWGLFRRPPAPVDVRYRGTAIAFSRRTSVEGQGAAGTGLVFVGPSEVLRHDAHGQTFRLVVPRAATLRPSREEVFASLAHASGALEVGDRDDEVLVVAAPEGVDWARRGLQTGEADLYVVADEPVDAADSTWLHEYVHTRQEFNLTAETRWLAEATAEYYAALLALEQDRVGFAAFRDVLARGERPRYASVVLADPGTWTAGADYLKGALVAGDLDRRLRVATDGGADLQRVFRRLNEASDPVEAAGFVSIVRGAGGDAVAADAERYTTTTAAPETWTRAEHGEAFGRLPARIGYALPGETDGEYRVRGPYRNRTHAGPPFVLVPGESLSVDVLVENVGGTAGAYDVSYGRAGEPVGTLAGSLDPGESRVETATVRFDEAGGSALRVGEYTLPVTVAEPASPSVSGVSVDRRAVAPGEAVGVRVEVENPADRPAAGNVTVTADGREVTTALVRLDAGGSATVTATASFEEPGEHLIAAGGRTATVTVGRAGGTDGVGGSAPGPGPLGVALAVAVAVALALAGRHR